MLDEYAARLMDEQAGNRGAASPVRGTEASTSGGNGTYGKRGRVDGTATFRGDSGGPSRFFHVAHEADTCFRYASKAPQPERPSYTKDDGTVVRHSTVKPLSVMEWLVRLTCPPGGTILDPFAGSGTTLEAGLLNGFDVIGCELDPDFVGLIEQRIERVHARLDTQPSLGAPESLPAPRPAGSVISQGS